MRKAIIITVTMAMIITAVFSGCTNPSQAESTREPSVSQNTKPDTASPTQEPTPIETHDDLPTVTVLDTQIAEAPLLDNGATLKDIAGFLNHGTTELLEQYEGQLEWIRSDFPYDEYYHNELGINVVCYSPGDSYPHQEGIAKYIELDSDKITLGGISASMNFEQVMSILGKTRIHELEDGLPGLMTYELRYTYEGINLRIYSWDMNGDSGIYASILDEFIPEYRPIRITPEQINRYFKLSLEELKIELGEGDMKPYGRYIFYPQFGVDFLYDERGEQLLGIDLDSRYQINNLKDGIRLEDVMSIMGETEVKEYYILDEEDPFDDGLRYDIRYMFDNFGLKIINHGFYDDWRAYWHILASDIIDSRYY